MIEAVAFASDGTARDGGALKPWPLDTGAARARASSIRA
jgi:hypothetical protein